LVAVEVERSRWAGSSVQLDPFYVEVPSNASTAPAGSPLKIEQQTNTTLYTLPAGVALSRMLFTTKTLNGSVVPASAFVLWPWAARRFNSVSGLPVVGWAHGTSGWSGECGPSHIRTLWYQYNAPFTLALQGYVVVAPDYAGLGLDHDAEGDFIAHPFAANPAHGNDMIYSVQAAQKAWPALSEQFVLMGHSQGGGAAWGAAEQLAKEPVAGYLGTIAGSPLTSLIALVDLVVELGIDNSVIGSFLAKFATGISAIFPTFQLSDWLTEEGIGLTKVMQGLQGCQAVALELLASETIQRDDWNETWYLPAFEALTQSGGKEFAGPMLVLQGSIDEAVPAVLTTAAVNETCSKLPDSQLHYVLFENVSHVPVLNTGQQIWLDWISDRFDGVPVPKGCVQETLVSQLNSDAYLVETGFTLEYALYPYELA
jgi:pimeloyl-ACP methyl ester carboxylesterase